MEEQKKINIKIQNNAEQKFDILIKEQQEKIKNADTKNKKLEEKKLEELKIEKSSLSTNTVFAELVSNPANTKNFLDSFNSPASNLNSIVVNSDYLNSPSPFSTVTPETFSIFRSKSHKCSKCHYPFEYQNYRGALSGGAFSLSVKCPKCDNYDYL